MNKEKKSFPFGTIIGVLVIAVLGVGGFMLFRDTTPPAIEIEPQITKVGPETEFIISAQDLGSGIKNVEAFAKSGKKTIPLFSETVSGQTTDFRKKLTLGDFGIEDGPLTISVAARDNSFYPFGQAGKATTEKTFTLDSRAPDIYVQTHITNLTQGGTGFLIYSLSEQVKSTGIQVGKRMFPAYRQAKFGDKNIYYCLFAMPWDTSPAEFSPMIVAVDEAGNKAERGFSYHANAHRFRNDRINLSDGFFKRTVPEFNRYISNQGTLLEKYLEINNKVRAANRAELVKIGLDTADEMLWKGAFKRLPNAASRARFADERDYMYQGKKVDHQTHLGIDLASIRQAKVPAANDGIIAFADFNGIYGNCVIVDHGLGLQTLYAHLSKILVKPNDNVSKGQTVGLTGTTGLAGGDHLHYGVILSGTPVQPLEWWDARWIDHNVTSKLE